MLKNILKETTVSKAILTSFVYWICEIFNKHEPIAAKLIYRYDS